MERCRCELLNVMSGAVARDYAASHLEHRRVDGMGRNILGCRDSEVEWLEERRPNAYADDVLVLRRLVT